MSKQLEKLTEKALRTGFANLNGRYYIYYQGYSELESKWQVQYDNETGDLELYHWGTKILKLGSLKASKPIVRSFTDNLNQIVMHLHLCFITLIYLMVQVIARLWILSTYLLTLVQVQKNGKQFNQVL